MENGTFLFASWASVASFAAPILFFITNPLPHSHFWIAPPNELPLVYGRLCIWLIILSKIRCPYKKIYILVTSHKRGSSFRAANFSIGEWWRPLLKESPAANSNSLPYKSLYKFVDKVRDNLEMVLHPDIILSLMITKLLSWKVKAEIRWSCSQDYDSLAHWITTIAWLARVTKRLLMRPSVRIQW